MILTWVKLLTNNNPTASTVMKCALECRDTKKQIQIYNDSIQCGHSKIQSQLEYQVFYRYRNITAGH